jgi:catalase-peroxidase
MLSMAVSLIYIYKNNRGKLMSTSGKCPFMHGSTTTPNKGTQNKDWWPNQLNLDILRQHDTKSNPVHDENYRESVKSLDIDQVKSDIQQVMRTSQDWWPADYGHYGPFFIRLTWHAAGTYRTGDGRGGAGTGAQRFAPLNSWPDNGNLDKARRLLWPIKEKYGNRLSWADLLVLAGNVAIEDMGGPNHGTALGRVDIWHPEKDIYWGAEDAWLGDDRYGATRQDLENPLAAVQMGLIYVNPEGPNGNPDPALSAQDIRETFARMAMNDEETVALVAGGHTFGKAHGNGPGDAVGVEPEGAPIEAMGFGWLSSHRTGKGVDAITSGIEGPWTSNPIRWDMGYLELLFKYEWTLTKSPAGANIWHPAGISSEDLAPEVDGSTKVTPMMTTADMALKTDPAYRVICKQFLANPEEFGAAFARAWFKLLHRDMGPKSNYAAGDYNDAEYVWQDPTPAGKRLNEGEIASVKKLIAETDLTITEMVETSWASASTFRGSDLRGGANGARIRLAPQKSWGANKPEQLAKVLNEYAVIASQTGASIADVIVIGGAVAIERASNAEVPVTTGRGDASQHVTDVTSFDLLEPRADGFRNYSEKEFSVSPEEMMLDKAQLLGLNPVEMTVLVGGLRSLGVSGSVEGLWTNGDSLDNSWFKTLLAMDVEWIAAGFNSYEAKNRGTGVVERTGSRTDLVFGSNSELRAIAEIYAQNDGKDKFVRDFIAAWNKVMDADRFDLRA